MSKISPVKPPKGLTEIKRQKLVNIQKREQLKGLLINKFKTRYGQQNVSSTVISEQVNKFLDKQKLTEDNLKKLDVEIFKEVQKKEQSKKKHAEATKEKRISGSRPQTVSSIKSAKSYASSRISNAEHPAHDRHGKRIDHAHGKPSDKAMSEFSETASVFSKTSKLDSVYKGTNKEDDEWAAILNFNTKLHLEEMKAEIIKEKEQKKFMKTQLDRQLAEKKQHKMYENKEDKDYYHKQMDHLGYLEMKEKEKKEAFKNKVMSAKQSRDKQMQEERMRKHFLIQEERKAEKEQSNLLYILFFTINLILLFVLLIYLLFYQYCNDSLLILCSGEIEARNGRGEENQHGQTRNGEELLAEHDARERSNKASSS